jgi:DNA topoisomerase-1
MNVVVVESPAKAKTINRYLGKDYKVLASYGHVRDLPPKDGSVEPTRDFAMSWLVDAKAAKRVNEIADALKHSAKLILATDPDREGEAISWHVLEILKKKGLLKDKFVERVVFNAITSKSVLEAMRNPRQLDPALIDAYLARRALDYLVGFTLSPVLWRKLPGARSAGRVQSVALRLICDRELEIEAFRAQEYWSVGAIFRTGSGDTFPARLAAIDGDKLGRLDIKSATDANAIENALAGRRFTVASVETSPVKRHPYPPFRTATLQQEASRKLGFSSKETMQIAQRLYEGVNIGGETVGLITYMRTDGVQMAGEAVAATRNAISKNFGDRYLPDVPRAYSSKAKNAQEAHEAIRPTDLARHPAAVSKRLERSQAALYELIWKRTVASQMASAEFERTTADIVADGGDGKHYAFRATGSVVMFDGFLRLYQEDIDDGEDENGKRLPKLTPGEEVAAEEVKAEQHFTEPPPRYSEASLIKKMEELGIGRPSTYTAILSVLRDRGYVRAEKKRLLPEDKGRLVTAFLEAFFARYVEYGFTADLEELLDRISAGEVNWKDVLRDFWRDFAASVEGTKDLRVSAVLDALNDILAPHLFPSRSDGGDPRACPSCGNGRLSLKLGKFGAFIGCENYPDCRYTRQISQGENGGDQAIPADGIVLGREPETGLMVTRRLGRFGPYVQLGEATEEEKPKRSAIPRGWNAESIDLERALQLLSLPREVGIHPQSGQPITANFGRYGPYIVHDGTYANLPSADDVFTIGINRAVDLLVEKKSRAPRGSSLELKDLGNHPEGGRVRVLRGRYGPYVKWQKINATLPDGKNAESITLEDALSLIAARTAKAAPRKKSRTKKKKNAEPSAVENAGDA